jgi:hypothetical protein
MGNVYRRAQRNSRHLRFEKERRRDIRYAQLEMKGE